LPAWYIDSIFEAGEIIIPNSTIRHDENAKLQLARAVECRTESFEMEVECSGGNVNQTIRIAGINMHRMDQQSEIIQGTG
jgi:hypothetical protein